MAEQNSRKFNLIPHGHEHERLSHKHERLGAIFKSLYHFKFVSSLTILHDFVLFLCEGYPPVRVICRFFFLLLAKIDQCGLSAVRVNGWKLGYFNFTECTMYIRTFVYKQLSGCMMALSLCQYNTHLCISLK